MVVGSPRRIQADTLKLVKMLPFAEMDKEFDEIVKELAQFCLDCPEEHKKSKENERRLKKKK